MKRFPRLLSGAVFWSLVGHDGEEVNWDIEDNQAGYFSWIRSFDQMVTELIEDGYIIDEGEKLVPTEAEPVSEYSHLVYSPHRSG